MQIYLQMHDARPDINMSWACLYSRVSHMLCWLSIGLPCEPCSFSLNAHRRNRPGSQATVCRWSRYVPVQNIPSTLPAPCRPIRVHQHGEKWIRPRQCGPWNHRHLPAARASRQYGQNPHVQTKAHDMRIRQKHVHEPLAIYISLSEAGVDAAQPRGVILGCVVVSVSQWSVAEA